MRFVQFRRKQFSLASCGDMFLAEVDIRRGNLDRLEARSRQFLALPKMNRLPQKVSLVSQTAAVLVEEIESGRWAS